MVTPLSAVRFLLGDACRRSCCKNAEGRRITITCDREQQCQGAASAGVVITVADTGSGVEDVGSYCNELLDREFATEIEKLSENLFQWDCHENTIRSYMASLVGEVPTIQQQPSKPKLKPSFSGSEARIMVSGRIEDFIIQVHQLCNQVIILNMRALIELRVTNFEYLRLSGMFPDDNTAGGCLRQIFDAGVSLSHAASDLERLKVGVQRHHQQHSCRCAPTENQQAAEWIFGAGAAQAGQDTTSKNTTWTVHACIAVLPIGGDGITETMPILHAKVDFFDTYSVRFAPASVMRILQSRVEWAMFGLGVDATVKNSDGSGHIQWESAGFPGRMHIYLHQFSPTPQTRMRAAVEVKLVKTAIELALKGLKASNQILFYSKHQKKVQRFVPDLARCIAGIVSSSRNLNFKKECCSMLDFEGIAPLGELEADIRERLDGVVEAIDVSSTEVDVPDELGPSTPSDDDEDGCDDTQDMDVDEF